MKPIAVQQLLEELKDESITGSADATAKSKVVVYLHAKDDEGITFLGADCALVLDSIDRIDRLADALRTVDDADMEEASICLFDVSVADDVRDALERTFSAVDEG